MATAAIGRPMKHDRCETIGGALSHGTTVSAAMPHAIPSAITASSAAALVTSTPGTANSDRPVAEPVRYSAPASLPASGRSSSI